MAIFEMSSRLPTQGSPLVALILCGVVVLGVYKILRIGSRDSRLPPGPPTVPILGNAHLISPTGLYEQFLGWAEKYGGVFSLKVGQSTMIVLADRKAVHKLLIEKGSLHSSRPPLYAINNLIVKNANISNHVDDKEWREKRKIISHYLSPKQLDERHYKVQEAEATVLMNQILDDPSSFYYNIQRYTLSVISSLTMGQRAATWDSWWCADAYKIFQELTLLLEPGNAPPADEFPLLKLVPSFLAKWKRDFWNFGLKLDNYWYKAVDKVKQRRKTGARRNCIADTLFDEWEKNGCPVSEYSATMLFAEFVTAGADTTASQLLTLIIAFAKYPHFADKARKEIDAVCGTTRTPVFKDFKDLPYVNCQG